MAVHFASEEHRARFVEGVKPFLGDAYREVVVYIFSLNTSMWGSLQPWLAGRKWQATYRATNGATVQLSPTEETLAGLAWALFASGSWDVKGIKGLDYDLWQVCLEAFRIYRVGSIQRLGEVIC